MSNNNNNNKYQPPVFTAAEMQRLIYFWYSVMSALAVSGLVCVCVLVWYYFVRFVPLKDQSRDYELTAWIPRTAMTCFVVIICTIAGLSRLLETRGIPWHEGATMLP